MPHPREGRRFYGGYSCGCKFAHYTDGGNYLYVDDRCAYHRVGERNGDGTVSVAMSEWPSGERDDTLGCD